MGINIFAGWLKKKDNERIKKIKSWLVELEPGKKILDAGAGNMPFRNFIEKRGLMYYSHDFGQYTGGEKWGLSNAKVWESKKCSIISDITNIPVEDNSFDYILCTEVLEHIFDPEKATKELIRILKPKGCILFTIPFACLPHQKPYFFNSGLSAEWFEKIGENKNCKIKIKKLGSLGDQIVRFTIIRASNNKNIFLKASFYFLSLLEIIVNKISEDGLDFYDSLIVTIEKR